MSRIFIAWDQLKTTSYGKFSQTSIEEVTKPEKVYKKTYTWLDLLFEKRQDCPSSITKLK